MDEARRLHLNNPDEGDIAAAIAATRAANGGVPSQSHLDALAQTSLSGAAALAARAGLGGASSLSQHAAPALGSGASSLTPSAAGPGTSSLNRYSVALAGRLPQNGAPPSPTVSQTKLAGVNLDHIKVLAAAGRHDLLPYLTGNHRPQAGTQPAPAATEGQRPRSMSSPSGPTPTATLTVSSANAAQNEGVVDTPHPPQTKSSSSDNKLRIPPPGAPMPSMANVQLTDIPTPYIHPNDVLCGRGGGTNNHSGNERFRELVNQQKVLYLHSSKRDKPFVSRGIVRAVRIQNPPGRFLQKDEKTGLWYDIGDQKAREKTSQALREGAPEIRREITSNLAVGSVVPKAGPPGLLYGGQPMQAPSGQAPGLVGATNANSLAAAAFFQQSGAGLNPFASIDHIRLAAAREAKQPNAPELEHAAINAQVRTNALNKLQHARAAAHQNEQVTRFGSLSPVSRLAGQPSLLGFGRGAAPSGARIPGPPFNSGMVGPEGVAGSHEQMLALGRGRSLSNRVPAPRKVVGGARSTVGGISGHGGQVRIPPQSQQQQQQQHQQQQHHQQQHQQQQQQHLQLQLQPQQPTPPKQKKLIPSSGRIFQQSMPRAPRTRKKETSHHPSLSHDTARRLVLAEMVAQKTVNGTITQKLKDEEHRVSLYLDAGLLGIEREDMAQMINEGKEESDVIQHFYDKLAAEKNSNGKRPNMNALLPPVKKSNTNKETALSGLGALSDEGVKNALMAIGAT